MSPIKLAIVGGGPSAFYVASRLLRSPKADSLRVHVYDRLWSPHGLVRYGVAPDHPEVKNCTHKFDETAIDPRFRFFGNVNIGSSPYALIPHAIPLPLTSLLPHYTHLLFASGCTLPNLHPYLPPSSHCVSALSLVHWYTQHPSRPPAPALDKYERVTLIGHGNVSLDVARILLSSPSSLARYDLPQPVLDILSRSAVRHVDIVGRRGPLQAAFTMKEMRELINLEGASMVPTGDPSVLTPPPNVSLTRQQARLLPLLQKGSRNAAGTTRKTWSLHFFRSPTSLSIPTSADSLVYLTLAHTTLDPTTQRAIPTGAHTTLPTSLVVTSLGFHAEPTNPFYDSTLGHLRTTPEGRVLSPSGRVLRKVYASGWAATGAKGVLASTMINSNDVASTILSDMDHSDTALAENEEDVGLSSDSIYPNDPPPEIKDALAEGLVVDYPHWKKIDAEEARRGHEKGKERERMDWREATRFIRQGS